MFFLSKDFSKHFGFSRPNSVIMSSLTFGVAVSEQGVRGTISPSSVFDGRVSLEARSEQDRGTYVGISLTSILGRRN